MTEKFEIDEIRFTYINWKGETSFRRAVPYKVRWGSNEYHTQVQWLMLAFDLDKEEDCEFAMKDMSCITGKVQRWFM